MKHTDAFVCEIIVATCCLKIFEWVNGLISVEVENIEEFSLGEWLRFRSDCVKEQSNKESMKGSVEAMTTLRDTNKTEINVTVEEKNGEVFITTLAFRPEKNLSRHLQLLYNKKVWSPRLHLIDDPDRICNMEEQHNITEVVVKYVKDSPLPFKVVSAKPFTDSSFYKFVDFAPWNQWDYLDNYHNSSIPKIHAKITSSDKPVSRNRPLYGFCLLKNGYNPYHNPGHKGSKLTADYIFCAKYGAIRYTKQAMDINVGDECSFCVNDRRQRDDRDKKTNRNHSYKPREVPIKHFEALTVAKLAIVPQEQKQMKTWQITSKARPGSEMILGPEPRKELFQHFNAEYPFVFDHDMLEVVENREITDWRKRSAGLSVTAHFRHKFLGKVEIYPFLSEFIIRVIEAHRQQLTAEKREKLEKVPIMVTVNVRLLGTWRINMKKGGDMACFMANQVLKICYGVGDEENIFDDRENPKAS